MAPTDDPTRQKVLKIFDAAEPVERLPGDTVLLTTGEVAAEAGAPITKVRDRLEQMHADGDVGKKPVGDNGAVWWANVAPRLDPDVAAELDEREDGEYVPLEREETISHDELKDELDVE